jgi:hypothetical protein
MTSKQRMATAMRLGRPDRVPVMCQLSLGHYFLHSGVAPFDVWYRSEGFAEALIRLRARYRFDGILINMPGRPPDIERFITRVERNDRAETIHWRNGGYSVLPRDDCAHYYHPDGRRFFARFEDLDPDKLYYVEPWDVWDITYPQQWAFEEGLRPFNDFFPPYHLDTIKAVLRRAGSDVSVHSEVFSPFSQLLELLNYENALVALMDDPAKVHACLARLTAGTIDLACQHAALGVDAVLISSAFAGAGFISRDNYAAFVLPYERQVVDGIQARFDVPVYTHTCGSIGDRLDLMLATGLNGVDTLDPPPLGTVDLAEAKRILQGKAFIKGNMDSVNTLLQGTLEQVVADAKHRLAIGKPGGGYILSSACSVAPAVAPEKLEVLVPLADEFGRY